MKLDVSLLMIMLLLLVTGCASNGGTGTQPDAQMQVGYIFEVNESGNSILVLEHVKTADLGKSWNDLFQEYQGDAIWLRTSQASTFKVGQKIHYWIDGPVAESHPMQGTAKKIEVITEKPQ